MQLFSEIIVKVVDNVKNMWYDLSMITDLKTKREKSIAEIECAIQNVRAFGNSEYIDLEIDDEGNSVEIRVSDHAREFKGYANSNFGIPDLSLIVANKRQADCIGFDIDKWEYEKVNEFSPIRGTAVIIPGARAKKVAQQIVNALVIS